MQELFEDIPFSFRKECSDFMNLISVFPASWPKGKSMVTNYRNSLNARQKEFFDFYWNVWMEEHDIHDGIIDQW